MLKKPKDVSKEPEPVQAPPPQGGGFPLPKSGMLVFQHPAEKGFVAWNGPTVKELVDEKAQHVMAAEVEKYKAITIRPTVQDVELLDELAKLFRQSRNEAACALLGAALREALNSLPDHIRQRVQVEAFKRLDWALATPEGVVLPDSMFKDGKLITPDARPSAPQKPSADSKSETGTVSEE